MLHGLLLSAPEGLTAEDRVSPLIVYGDLADPLGYDNYWSYRRSIGRLG
jgi:hypothetical protein